MIYGYDTVSIIGNDVNYRDLMIVDDGSSRKETSRTSSTWIQNSIICPSCHNSNCLTKHNYYCVLY